MKLIKSIVTLGNLFERASQTSQRMDTRRSFRSWIQVAGLYSLLWLLSAVFMAGVSYYAAEHLATLYIADRMHNIVDLDNGNFVAFHPRALGDLALSGNFETVSPLHWPALLAKTYVFIEFSIWLSIFISGIFAILGIYKVMKLLHVQHFSLLAQFRQALRNDEVRVHYQPIVNMNNGVWRGAEALLRWDYKGRAISPAVFIPLIEQSGLMPLTTRWVCQQVIGDYSRFISACDELYISINLSAQDLLDPTFPDFMQALLERYQEPALRFVFEITEGVVLNKAEAVVQLNRLREQGHKIALDDFGTGYSSLAYLECLPLDILKIDRSFLNKKDGLPMNVVLSHILDLARHLKLEVIVEGVETPVQVERLLVLGVKTAQGWYYSKELSVDELVRGYFSLNRQDMDSPI